MDHSFLIELLNYKIKFTYTSKYLIINYLKVKLLIGVDSNLILEFLSVNKTFTDYVLEPPFGGRGSKNELKGSNSFIAKMYEG